MRMNITVDMDDLAESMCLEARRQDVISFILKLDSLHAECSFTEDLILRLVESLKSDYGPVDFQELIDAIKMKVES